MRYSLPCRTALPCGTVYPTTMLCGTVWLEGMPCGTTYLIVMPYTCDPAQDYFTNKVYSVGKSGAPRDVTQGNPYGPLHGALRYVIFPIFMAIAMHLAAFHKIIRPKFNNETLISYVRCILNPISGRLLATPISGRRDVCLGPPLRSPVLTGRFLKLKRHSFRLNMIYISKKRNLKNS